jgi:hypothetical protein
VENCGKARGENSPPLNANLGACSACAGEYEDPDETAKRPEEDEAYVGGRDESKEKD